ncbi:MAG TPA: hypothetical protein VMF50_04900 [Candidatus Binataceae bacterium]|nr:hypothetical protein [Candidatus Binataceae bacterium]
MRRIAILTGYRQLELIPSINILSHRLSYAALILAIGAASCAVAPAPIKDRPQIVATPRNGELAVTSTPGKTIGDVQPVYVSIANGTDIPRTVIPDQIFALNDYGDRIAPLPPKEAARVAGGAGELKAALLSGAASGAVLGAVGTGVGAIAGSLISNGAVGAGVGAAIGAGYGGLEGVALGPGRARAQANDQLTALALQHQDVRHDFTVSGYVFFPKGEYKELQLLLVDSESGDTDVISEPWH